MKTLAIVQARTASTRFPNKVMASLGSGSVIGALLGRLKKSKEIDQIVVAIADDAGSSSLAMHVRELGFEVFIGSEKDVLNRFYLAACKFDADVVVRITGDCPLVDPDLVDKVLEVRTLNNADYSSNIDPPTFPDGYDVEAFTFEALRVAELECSLDFDREHVTPYLRRESRFTKVNHSHTSDVSHLRLTLDEISDLDVLGKIYSKFQDNLNFGLTEVLELFQEQPELFEANSHISRNEGAYMGKGQKLWTRAKGVIPGGSMLLSKRSELYLPDKWPSYFSRAKGCEVWDLDDIHFFDMSTMSVGTNTLGYGDEFVDDAVRKVISSGNMSSLNAPEEVYLAEKLIELNPWAGMVRFARTGGEANAIAVRIARAATGRDEIAICGYHGWHDWYLSANLADDASLDGHLIPGLEPKGVPRNLMGTVHTFNYNDIDSLKNLIATRDLAAIKMEVVRSSEPENNFLTEIRELATRNGIVLIFDECTSGFRETYGGLHLKYGVNPDLAVFGKALGNGYAVTAVIGRTEIMQEAQSTFISSTFWTERIGSAAGLATLSRMKELESWKAISKIGSIVRTGWDEIAKESGVQIKHAGLPSLASFSFVSSNALHYKTYMTQEMLKRGFLASTLFYASVAHTDSIIDQYLEALRPVFRKIGSFSDGDSISDLLDGPVSQSGFKRLN